jgi:hypothetical protein
MAYKESPSEMIFECFYGRPEREPGLIMVQTRRLSPSIFLVAFRPK